MQQNIVQLGKTVGIGKTEKAFLLLVSRLLLTILHF